MNEVIESALSLAAVGALLVAVAYLALRRADISYEDLEARYARPDDKFIDLPGAIRAHYRIAGRADGPVLLLSHAYSLDLTTWDQWISQVGDTHRLISVDFPGHGLTRAPPGYDATFPALTTFLKDFTDTLGLERFVAIGNSMGGHASWLLARAYPERVSALVLISSAGWLPPPSQKRPLALRLMENETLQPILGGLDPTPVVTSGLNDAYNDKSFVTAATIRHYAEIARAPDHRRLLSAIILERGNEHGAMREKLASITMPTLILWGEADHVIPVSNAHLFAAAMPHAKLILYPHLGHLPQQEAPAQTAADLKAFLTQA